ncbi:MAG: hypothetical protein KDM64_08495 [Verrucomicrobiae bacterium]|nr:hypothetical protein [Verrucomicrobiae bacterium]
MALYSVSAGDLVAVSGDWFDFSGWIRVRISRSINHQNGCDSNSQNSAFSQLLENSAPENPEISLKVPSPLDPDSNPRFPPQDTISWCEGNSLAQYIVAGQAFFSARPQDMGAIFGPKSFGNLNIKHLRELNFFRGDFGPKSRPSVNPKPKKKCHLVVSPEAAGPATRKEVGIVQSSP